MFNDQFWGSIVTIGTAIIGVALLATLVSRNSQTPQVISAAGQAFGSALGVALSPITGTSAIGGSTFSNAGYAGFPMNTAYNYV